MSRTLFADRGLAVGVTPVIGDITDAIRLDSVFAQYRPEVVFHAAAHKHVPMMEANPCEAVKNNVIGTRLVAEAAARHGVARVRADLDRQGGQPDQCDGGHQARGRAHRDGLRAGESRSPTAFRRGALRQRAGQQRQCGAALPRADQERRADHDYPCRDAPLLHADPRGGPAHPPRGRTGRDSGTYVLDMGEQIKIADMARNLIRLSGFVPDEDIKLEFVGLRPGEKLFEELIGARETVQPSSIQKVFEVVSEDVRPAGWFRGEMRRLERVAKLGDSTEVMRTLRRIVPNSPAGPGKLPRKRRENCAPALSPCRCWRSNAAYPRRRKARAQARRSRRGRSPTPARRLAREGQTSVQLGG